MSYIIISDDFVKKKEPLLTKIEELIGGRVAFSIEGKGAGLFPPFVELERHHAGGAVVAEDRH